MALSERPAEHREPVLAIRGLTKRFDVGTLRARRVVHALNAVDLDLHAGEIVGLVGESGSGKTTLARVIAYLEPPSAGSVTVVGRRLPDRPTAAALKDHRRRVQMVFQDPYASLNPLHTVLRTLAEPLRAFAVVPPGQERAEAARLLEQVGLAPADEFLDRYPYELSGGQRQRVGIARALAPRPAVILADEPTSMLDVSVRLTVLNLLLDLRDARGLSMIFITHDLGSAYYVSDRIAILYAGHLLEEGPAESVLGSPKHPYTQLLRSAAPDPASGFGRGEAFDALGDPPDLADPPPGCPFEPRCPHAEPACRQALPSWRAVGPAHRVRCILYPEVPADPASVNGGPPARA
jgi:peptide/nickel transport system ATP-binding protein